MSDISHTDAGARAKVVSRDEFISAAHNGGAEGLGLIKEFSAEIKAVESNDRALDFVISTASVDRQSDTIAVDGWQLNNYMRAPVVLWGHNSSDPPIGRALSVSKTSSGLISRAEFMDRELSPFADTIFRMYQKGFLFGVSVGFLPIKYEFSKDKAREWGVDFLSQELLEFSACSVPANPDCLMRAKASGIDLVPLSEWAERILDGDGKVSIPRSFLEETFRAAKTPLKVRQKYLSPERKDGAAWTVGAARDLPVADTDASWDGPAAAARMFAAAGFDGDSPDSAKVRRGFLVYDSANPDLKGSYRLPFADVVDGGLKAIPSGIRAAASRLPQTDAPQEVLDNARNILDDYEGKMVDADSKAATIEDIIGKAGNVLSSANRALLTKAADCMGGAMDSHQKAMDLHQQASDCVKSVMSSAGMMDDDGDEMDPANMPSDHVMGGKDLSPEAIAAAVAAAEADAKAAEELAKVAAAARERRVRHANALKRAAEVL